jgi:hypothetical protein
MPSMPQPNETPSWTTKVSDPEGKVIMKAPAEQHARVHPYREIRQRHRLARGGL